MNRNRLFAFSAIAVVVSACLLASPAHAAPPVVGKTGESKTNTASGKKLLTVQEARGRTELLHEAFHATLQIVHLQYFSEDDGTPIPSRTLEAVFDAIQPGCNMKFRWLAVDALAMNIDHAPEDAFERDAIEALKAGKDTFERVENGVYRRVGKITLSSQCLKCHLPSRTNNEDRSAGLVISTPVRGH